MPTTDFYDAIIIGAGAAGLYAALHAGRRDRRVLVLEHNAEPGAKIVISGGGRCNFTNIDADDHRRYLSANPHFARSALTRHSPADFIALIQRHGIAHYEKTLGQLFCEGARSSQKIVRMLLDECAAGQVELRTLAQIGAIAKSDRFRVDTSLGSFESETLTIATGGLSIPKLGASSFAVDVARQFSVPIVETRPGLVPLTFNDNDLAWMRPLAGVSADIVARSGGVAFREAALFTHRGLSGPAILQASSYWREGDSILIDWLPDAGQEWLAERKRLRPKAYLKAILSEALSERLAGALADLLPPVAIGDMKDAALNDIMRALKSYELAPIETEGYAKAEVTVGGVDTSALSQQTMECRAAPGLFFVGECVDVTGWLGGYNFQWAWSSAWAAGQAI
jgi:hypothetical protein